MNPRNVAWLWAALVIVAVPLRSSAQDKPKGGAEEEGEVTFDADDVSKPVPEPDPNAPEPAQPKDQVKSVKPIKADPEADGRTSWQDIVVVVRKPFLKLHRLELYPSVGVTMNDNIVRHQQANLQVNYFLTDILAVGLEGHLYDYSLREPFDLVSRQARRLPTVNKYNWGAALNFHYVPIYGKFAILDDYLIHWETFFTAGVGITESEVLPRDPRFLPFTNRLITPNVGLSMRFFVTKWLTVNIGLRDYLFVDKFEPQNRSDTMSPTPEEAKRNADSTLVNNVVFQAGISIWFPFSFDYTTFR